MNKPFRVLSIDGGGIRGIFPAQILSLIETKLNININKTFDLIVGTSTGSIIAGAVVNKYNLTTLVNDYAKNAPEIFKKQWSICGLARSKYKSNNLEKFLHEKLGDTKLGEIQKPLILNATNASIGDVYLFKSSYQKQQRNGDYVRDAEVPLYKAVLASCSAPTYFDPVDINGTLVCDGGIWANNPSLVGYTDAKKNFRADKIQILSLGTGERKQIYKPAKFWGILSGWRISQLVDFIMSCQTTFPQNVLKLLNSKAILRINEEIENYPLDDYGNVHTLKELAKNVFASKNQEIQDFLCLGGSKDNET